MTNKEYDKLLEAKYTLCRYCEDREHCGACIADHITDQAYKELKRQNQSEKKSQEVASAHGMPQFPKTSKEVT